MASQISTAYLFTTISDIDEEEIERTIHRAEGVLKKMALEAGYSNLYSMKDLKQCDRLLLYLRLYALQSWDNADNAINFFSVDNMKKMLSSVEQSFGTCS